MSKRDPITLLKEFQVPYIDKGLEFLTIECPYHDDKKENVADCKGGIHRTNGAFKCFYCGVTRNILNVLAVKYGQPERIISAHADNIYGDIAGNIDNSQVEMWHSELLVNHVVRTKLEAIHGITIQAIEKWRMGWIESNERVVLPIKNKSGDYYNTRMYKYPGADGMAPKNKMISRKGSRASLWPLEALSHQEVIITEGEFKAIIMWINAFNTITGTAGAGTWKGEWNEFFRGKDVVLLLDADEAGRKGAEKLSYSIYPLVKSLKNIDLIECRDAGYKDVTDWFVKLGKTADELRAKITAAPLFVPPKISGAIDLEVNDPYMVKLAVSGHASYYHKIIETTAVVSAKGTSPYIIPKTVKVNCSKSKEYCTFCPVYRMSEEYKFEISAHNPTLLELLDKSAKAQDEIVKRASKIYYGCKVATFERLENHNIEEVRLIPQIAIGHASEEQVTRRAFSVGHEIRDNTTYTMTARSCVEPDSARATLLIYETKKAENDLDSFELTMDLKQFQPTAWTKQAVLAKLETIYEDLETNVTRIYQRRDLHLFYDIAWHSVLYIPFQGRIIKGWADVLCIGDSGQGKSETSSSMIKHYQCGERVDTKRASIAGIVGGLQETSNRWFITWGTIPLNDRRLVILEEIKGMPVEQFSRMTDMRSSGVAEIVKIERAKTNARTRLIMISNPRSETNKLSGYNFGVDAVRELIGSLEDIRRFDMVIAVASGEVSNDVVNAKSRPVVEHKYTSDLCSHLIAWAWSRKETEVIVECEDEILSAASRMSAMYSSSCPIVEPSDQRLKIARLAAGLAARTFSTDDGKTLVVRACHVEVVEEFLNRIYSSKALGYREYSESKHKEEEVVPVDFTSMPNAKDLIRGLIDLEFIRAEDLANFTALPMESCNEFLGKLIRNNCLRSGRRGSYRKTSGFISMLKKLDREGNVVNQTFNEILSKEKF